MRRNIDYARELFMRYRRIHRYTCTDSIKDYENASDLREAIADKLGIVGPWRYRFPDEMEGRVGQTSSYIAYWYHGKFHIQHMYLAALSTYWDNPKEIIHSRRRFKEKAALRLLTKLFPALRKQINVECDKHFQRQDAKTHKNEIDARNDHDVPFNLRRFVESERNPYKGDVCDEP